MLGRFGAAVASTLIIICGKGAWAIPVILVAWGARFVMHRGADRALGRMVFAVIARGHRLGLCRDAGAGDRLAAFLRSGRVVRRHRRRGAAGDPAGIAGFGLKLLSLASGVALVAMMLFVTGFDMAELRRLARFLLLGLVMGYAWIATMLGRGARGDGAGGAGRAGSPGRAASGGSVAAADDGVCRTEGLDDAAPCGARVGRRGAGAAAADGLTPAGGGLRADPRYAPDLRGGWPKRRRWPCLPCARVAAFWPGCRPS